MLRVNDVYFTPPCNNFNKINLVFNFIVVITYHNEFSDNDNIDEPCNDTDGVLVTVTPYIIILDVG